MPFTIASPLLSVNVSQTGRSRSTADGTSVTGWDADYSSRLVLGITKRVASSSLWQVLAYHINFRPLKINGSIRGRVVTIWPTCCTTVVRSIDTSWALVVVC